MAKAVRPSQRKPTEGHEALAEWCDRREHGAKRTPQGGDGEADAPKEKSQSETRDKHIKMRLDCGKSLIFDP